MLRGSSGTDMRACAAAAASAAAKSFHSGKPGMAWMGSHTPLIVGALALHETLRHSRNNAAAVIIFIGRAGTRAA